MIRYALVGLGVVLLYLWYQSRQAALVRRTSPTQATPSVWTALGQLLGGAIGAGAARSENQGRTPARPSADGIYSLLGNQKPTTSTVTYLPYTDPFGSPWAASAGQSSSGPAGMDEEYMLALAQDRYRGGTT